MFAVVSMFLERHAVCPAKNLLQRNYARYEVVSRSLTSLCKCFEERLNFVFVLFKLFFLLLDSYKR